MNNIISILVGNMDVIKALKSKYILLTPSYIYGTDEDCVILRRCSYISGIEKVSIEYVFNMDELNHLYKNCEYIKDIRTIGLAAFEISFINSANSILLNNNYCYIADFIDIINKLTPSMMSTNDIHEDLTNNEEFNILQDYKSGDGIYMYNHNGYIMSLYNGIIPRNKSDKVYLTIHDDGPTFIAIFTVEKKKLGKIDTFIRYIKLN